MMATTHALIGVALASATVVLAPEYALPAMAGAYVGGLLPDADLLWAHRRTFHYPVYGPLAGLLAVVIAVAMPSTVTVVLAAFIAAAGLHAALDVFGAGLELRPWEGTSERAVYDHHRNRWLAPRRWVRYDGAPEDVGLAVLAGLPAIYLGPPGVDWLVGATLAVSVAYALVRKPLVDLAEAISDRAPAPVAAQIDERLLDREVE